jgi:hypothetical protein
VAGAGADEVELERGEELGTDVAGGGHETHSRIALLEAAIGAVAEEVPPMSAG